MKIKAQYTKPMSENESNSKRTVHIQLHILTLEEPKCS